VIPGGVNSSTRYIGEPYALVAADGAYVTDADGRRYLDYHAAFGAILLGHNAPVVNDAVRAAMNGVDLTGIGVSELEVALAERIVEIIPSAEQMIATMSGSEATAQAIRLATSSSSSRAGSTAGTTPSPATSSPRRTRPMAATRCRRASSTRPSTPRSSPSSTTSTRWWNCSTGTRTASPR
jgi:4-aminobutyrate aminotransferase-like enzyme